MCNECHSLLSSLEYSRFKCTDISDILVSGPTGPCCSFNLFWLCPTGGTEPDRAGWGSHWDSPLTQQDSFPDLVEHPDRFENLDEEPILFSAGQLDEDDAVAQLSRDYDALALYDHTTFSSNTGRDRNSDRGEDATIASALTAINGTGLQLGLRQSC
jgi:hypothetical protein